MKYIRLYETTDLAELEMIKSTLRREEIDYKVLFEHTLLAGSLAAMGNHGAIFEVRDVDQARALELLRSLDVIVDMSALEEPSDFVRWVDDTTKKIPGIAHLDSGLRLYFFLAFCLVLVFLLFLLSLV